MATSTIEHKNLIGGKLYQEDFYWHNSALSVNFKLPSNTTNRTALIICGNRGEIIAFNNSGITVQSPIGNGLTISYDSTNQKLVIDGGVWYTNGFILSNYNFLQ